MVRLLAADPISSGIGSVVGVGVNAVFDAAGRWVADGAVWLLGGVGSMMSATTSVDLGAGWFRVHEAVMATLAAAVTVPLVCAATIQAVIRQSASMLLRAVFVHLPLALVFSGVAIELVRLGLAVTDVLSAQVLAAGGVDAGNILQPIAGVLATSGMSAPGVPSFVVFVAGILVACTALVLWVELVVRAAAVTAAALFLPLALAGLVFPAVSHWCRRLADTLVALVLSKLVVAAVLSLAAGAIAGGLGLGAPNGGGFASIVTGGALLAMAAFSPFTLLRLVPAVEAGAIAHLASARHQAAAGARVPLRAASFAADVAESVTPAGAAAGAATAGAATAGAAAPGVGTALAGAAGAGEGVAASAAAHGAGPGRAGAGVGGAPWGHEDQVWRDDPYGIPMMQGDPDGWEEIHRLLDRYREPDPRSPGPDAQGGPDHG